MGMFRKLFPRRPPDGLLEIEERVYVFDCCFTSETWKAEKYEVYVGGIIGQLRDQFLDASLLVFNFHEEETQSLMAKTLSEYDLTIMDYPRQYEGCPLLTLEVIHHFMRSSESWLALGPQNIMLMHCERGGWPVLAFMVSALLIYRKQYTGAYRTLEMVYKQAPHELLQLLSPLNPLPSQLRYLQYVSRRNVASDWPPLDKTLTLGCVILRSIPHFGGEDGCRPILRVYGPDPFHRSDQTPKVLYSSTKMSKTVRLYKQAECELVKIDLNCHIQGDVVLECISLHDDMLQEEMMFRAMFNTAFIRSNILILNRDEVDTPWNAKERFPKEFRAEILFFEMDASAGAASIVPVNLSCFEEEECLPIEAFFKVQEIFSHEHWLDPKTDAALNVLHQKLHEVSPGKLREKEKTIELKTNHKSLTESENNYKSPTCMAIENPNGPQLHTAPSEGTREKVNLQYEQVILEPPSQSEEVCLQTPQSSRPPSVSVPRCRSAPSTFSRFPLVHDNGSYVTPLMPDMPCTSTCKEQKSISVSLSPLIPPTLPPTQPNCTTGQTFRSPPLPPPPPPSHVSVAKTHSHGGCQPSLEGFPTSPVSISPHKSFSESYSDSPFSVLNSIPPPPQKQPPSTPPPPPPMMASLNLSTQRTPSPPPPLKEQLTIRAGPPPAPPPPPSTLKPILRNFTCVPNALPPPVTCGRDVSKTERKQPTAPPPLPVTTQPKLSTPSTPPPPPPTPSLKERLAVRVGPPPPPPPPTLPLKEHLAIGVGPPPPPPPPPPPSRTEKVAGPAILSSIPPPPPAPTLKPGLQNYSSIPSTPPQPPPAPFGKGVSKTDSRDNGLSKSLPRVPSYSSLTNAKGRLSRTISPRNSQIRKLKPLHWLKLTKAAQGTLWAEAQKFGETYNAPEIDMSELESLFSAGVSNSGSSGGNSSLRVSGPKSEKVQLIDHRRAYNCEIMLSKVKVPLHDLMNSVLALDDSALDDNQVDNLIKFCPTKEEMELLKGYIGPKEKLGKCEQFFLELMQVPRVESKLRVYSFKMQFRSQVSDLRTGLNVVNSAAEEIRKSVKLRQIMQTILSLGNALNQGTARGSAIGFKLDSLLKLTDTRSKNNKMTLMNYLCKVITDKLPELLDFFKDLPSLEFASKIQLKFLAEEMQDITKSLEKVIEELSLSENDGSVSEQFRKTLKEFLGFAEAEVKSLALLYSGVGKHMDALILYFGEDPSRCPFEQVVSTLHNFVKMFRQAHAENCKQLELEKKKAEKEPYSGKKKITASPESKHLLHSPVK